MFIILAPDVVENVYLLTIAKTAAKVINNFDSESGFVFKCETGIGWLSNFSRETLLKGKARYG
jgi:hypothetical protein